MSSQSNSVLVINLTTLQQHVDIVGSDGTKTSVNIMPKKRVTLEEGFSVCSNWVGRNPKALKVHTPEVDTTTTVATTSTESTAVATTSTTTASATTDKE